MKMETKHAVSEFFELLESDAKNIYGGSAFRWLGEVFGTFNAFMKEACKNGYQHAGLFY